MLKNIERFILRFQERHDIDHLHTIIIAVLLGFNAFTILLIILLAKSSISLPEVLLQFLKFLFIIIFLGVILGITSNYIYDQVLKAIRDKNGRAQRESKLLNYFLPDKESEKQRRTDLTVKRMQDMQGEVCLLAIAATSYLPMGHHPKRFSGEFIDKLLDGEIKLRLILLNPYTQAGKFRYAREKGIDVDTVGERRESRTEFTKSAFYSDVSRTLQKVEELKKNGATIECRLTNLEPTISMMCTNSFVYVDILSLGRSGDASKYLKQRGTLPILEFSSDSKYYQVAKSHFEYHWKYSITPDELDYYRPMMERNFFETSFTGYRLVKQHESWICIDPIVGCNIGCKYCVLRTTFGNNTKPRIYTNPELVGDLLGASRFYHDEATLCLFSYTDALIEENRRHLIKSLKSLKENNFRNWICIPTKVSFDEDFANNLANAYYKDRIIFFISLSGLSAQYEPGVNPGKLLATMKMLKEIGIPVVHYWRPVTGLNCSTDDIEDMLDKVCTYAEYSVVVGLKASQALNKYYAEEKLNIGPGQVHGDYLPKDFMSRVSARLKEREEDHSVYLHASCAVSKIKHQPDYNGTMFRENICSLHGGASICNAHQEKKCKRFKEEVEQDICEENPSQTIEEFLPGINFNFIGHGIELQDPVCQEDLISLIHRSKRPVKAKNIIYTNQYVGSIFG
jgi:DNA repair photolyase